MESLRSIPEERGSREMMESPLFTSVHLVLPPFAVVVIVMVRAIERECANWKRGTCWYCEWGVL